MIFVRVLTMVYEAKNFDRLIGIEGMSDQLLKNHFTLYQGYVANVNKIGELSQKLELSAPQYTPEHAELKRRFGWEYNGMVLHELYFENMVKGGKFLDKNSKLAKLITEKFGSFDKWEKDFRATGAMRGIGWVVLYYSKDDAGKERLFNIWINEHDVGHLAGATPLLVMDVFEHAYMVDYGLKKADYISAFMKAVDWEEVGKRMI